jgi:hypothetical protein
LLRGLRTCGRSTERRACRSSTSGTGLTLWLVPANVLEVLEVVLRRVILLTLGQHLERDIAEFVGVVHRQSALVRTEGHVHDSRQGAIGDLDGLLTGGVPEVERHVLLLALQRAVDGFQQQTKVSARAATVRFRFRRSDNNWHPAVRPDFHALCGLEVPCVKLELHSLTSGYLVDDVGQVGLFPGIKRT